MSSEGEVPQATTRPRGRSSIPLVWIIPAIASVVGLWMAVHTLLQHGPTITITFKTAEGLEAGKTHITYKNVDLGQVTGIVLSHDHTEVKVTARMTKEAKSYLVADTRFWVVRPRFAASGISGLQTVLSGTYIGMDIGKSSESKRDFIGLETPPVVTGDLPGRQYLLHGPDLGSLDIGSPIFYRRVNVGEVIGYDLTKDGSGVDVRVFIHSPYDRFVSENTRFWQASGVDVSVDANGVKIDTQSLVTILVGGLAFEVPAGLQPGAMAPPNALFALASNRSDAMKPPDRVRDRYVLYFNDSLRGLSAGAPVEYRGVVIGDVQSVRIVYDRQAHAFRFPVEINLYPDRIQTVQRDAKDQSDPGPAGEYQFVANLIRHGFRAQLRNGNLLTGQLYVAVDFFPRAASFEPDPQRSPMELPTVPGSLEELQTTLANISARIDKVPFDQIGTELRDDLKVLNQTLRDTDALMQQLNGHVAPEATAALEQAREALESANRTLSTDSPVQQDLQSALVELRKAAQSFRTLSDYLEAHPESVIRGKTEDPPQ
jgi:paraquat-inducible protein B